MTIKKTDWLQAMFFIALSELITRNRWCFFRIVKIV